MPGRRRASQGPPRGLPGASQGPPRGLPRGLPGASQGPFRGEGPPRTFKGPFKGPPEASQGASQGPPRHLSDLPPKVSLPGLLAPFRGVPEPFKISGPSQKQDRAFQQNLPVAPPTTLPDLSGAPMLVNSPHDRRAGRHAFSSLCRTVSKPFQASPRPFLTFSNSSQTAGPFLGRFRALPWKGSNDATNKPETVWEKLKSGIKASGFCKAPWRSVVAFIFPRQFIA